MPRLHQHSIKRVQMPKPLLLQWHQILWLTPSMLKGVQKSTKGTNRCQFNDPLLRLTIRMLKVVEKKYTKVQQQEGFWNSFASSVTQDTASWLSNQWGVNKVKEFWEKEQFWSNLNWYWRLQKSAKRSRRVKREEVNMISSEWRFRRLPVWNQTKVVSWLIKVWLLLNIWGPKVRNKKREEEKREKSERGYKCRGSLGRHEGRGGQQCFNTVQNWKYFYSLAAYVFYICTMKASLIF